MYLKIKTGDWVKAQMWRKNFTICETITTIVIDTNPRNPYEKGDILVFWEHADKSWLPIRKSWYISPDKNVDLQNDYGRVLGKVCPNTVPKCLKAKLENVIVSK